ncbi:MAG TPA: 4'-phosphopantetheinyl transferase superfamily protein [Anaeromyxobacter sp.]|nr:4'-phosphopantetheinyl transferase superfamily protein [Anaeromyxobacter sp.]
MSATPLSPDEVQVWRVDVPSDPAALARLAGALPAHERAWAERLRPGGPRGGFVTARSALRRLLAARLGCAPRDVPLETGPRGKPELERAAGARLRFSVSHSGGVALLAIAAQPVGVDVEAARRVHDPLALAARFFSPAERAAVQRAPAAERERRFLELWTAKEAALKVSGVGLPGLADVEVTAGPDGAACAVGPRGHRWALRALDAAPGCVAAIAAVRLPARLDVLHANGTASWSLGDG